MAEGVREAYKKHENPWAFSEEHLIPRRSEVSFHSLGAKANSIPTRRLNERYLKKLGTDIHKFKEEWIGKKKLGHFELHLAENNQIFIMGRQSSSMISEPTNYFIVNGQLIKKNIW